jgi:hypothetical protein
VSKTSNSETQERLRKEKTERDAKMAKQKADRLAAEDKKTDELEQHAKRVAALYKSMREFEAHAEEKAGFELKKAAEKRAALEQALVKARELCKAAGEDFKAFQEKYAPNYKRTRLYQVLAIADGRTTVEEVREGARDRKRRQRAGQSSVTEGDVTDSAAEGEPKPAPVTVQGERDIEAVKAHEFTDEAPAIAGSDEIDANARKAADEAMRAAETPTEAAEPPSTNGHVNKPDDDRPLAEKLHYHLNDIWSLCQDANNWSHLSADQKVELRGAMTRLGYLRDLLPRLATPAKSTMH